MSAFLSVDEWLNQKSAEKLITLGTQRISQVADLIFEKQKKTKSLPYIITIAGTNGKGTTGFLLSQIFNKLNIKAGWFSSPHLLVFNERIQINGEMQGDEEIIEALEKVEKYRIKAGVRLSYFEYTTLAALDLFIKNRVEVMILEVGLGGRFDATNIMDSDIAIITSIGLDHMHHLGNTKDKIAYEKAGILRKNQIALIGKNAQRKTIIQRTKELEMKTFCVGNEISYEPNNQELNQYNFNFFQSDEWVKIKVNLPKFINTNHQLSNATLSLAAIWQWGLKNNFKIPNLIDVSNCQFNGRNQKFNVNLIQYTVDVAHNPQAIKSFISSLNIAQKGKIIFVLALLKDKNYNKIIKLINPWAESYYLIPLENQRAFHPDELCEVIKKITDKKITIAKSGTEVIEMINQKYNNQGYQKKAVVIGCFALAEKIIPVLQTQNKLHKS